MGNAGAIGIQYSAANWGVLRDVSIQSGDVNLIGVKGLDMNYVGSGGPCMIKNVEVNGFDIGIDIGGFNQVTFEGITLNNQLIYGMNVAKNISLRNLTSNNSVPAIYSQGYISLLDSDINGQGSATTQTAIINYENIGAEAYLFVRNTTITGYHESSEFNIATTDWLYF